MALSPTRSPHAALGFILVTALLDIMALGIVIPVLPVLIEQFTGSNGRAGVLNGVFVALWAAMQFIASPIIGALSDRYGRRPVLLLSALGLSADYVLMALAPNLWWLAVGRLVAGITSSSFATGFAYMADITPPEDRARVYGLVGAAVSGGFVAGPLLGGLLGDWSPRAPFWVAAALSAITVLYGLVVLPESLPVERRVDFCWKRANPFGALTLLRSHPELSSLAMVSFLTNLVHHLFTVVFVLYAGHRYGWGPVQVGLVLALVGVLDAAVQGALVGPVAKRLGDSQTMVIGLCGSAVGIACMGLAPTGWLFSAAMLPNALWGLATPTLMALMTKRVSESEQGRLQGATASVGSIAGVFSPLFFGAVYSVSVGESAWVQLPGLVFLLASGALGLAGVIGWRTGQQAAARL